MKILFLLGAASRIRNFERTITILAERGHTLQLAGRPRKGRLELPKTLEANGVSIRENPTHRGDEWEPIADTLRGARDYVRYLDPRYAQATRLVRRAYEISPTAFVLFCERHPWLKRRWRLLSSILALCEELVPGAAAFEAFVREERPDLMLVTPLVTFESYQTDYVKAAHRLGIPVVFLPFSWDNLTNKGLMRVLPDRVIVWNEVQKREAVELHGMPADRVAIAGAARFDEFFTRRPSAGREEFFAQYGLDPARPMVLYLGSSQLTGPNEMELVRQWAEALRRSDQPVLRTCGILVRPHPALKSSWASVDLGDLGNVGLSLTARRSADQELFDSLWHAHAAVGLNTSAMLEAAIVGRPVHTLLIPGFDEGQVGTIHFRYLVEAFGGLVTVARSFAEHQAQLVDVLAGPPQRVDRSGRFAASFLRPHGVDRPVSPILADLIERPLGTRKRARAGTPIWHRPLRWMLHAWLARRHEPRADRQVEDRSPVATSMSLRPVRTALEELRRESGPIFVGPWLDDIGKELLYWIPFVRWATRTYGLDPDRLIVVSRAGARPWYGTLAGRYLDARELFSGAEFDEWLRRTIPQSRQNPKQAVMYPFDQEILQRAAAAMEVPDPRALHPLMFFRVLQRLQADQETGRLREALVHERLTPAASPRPDAAAALPREYVAMSLAFTEALPCRSATEELLPQLLSRVAASHEVVVVDAASDLAAGHPAVRSGRVHLLSSRIGDSDLVLQTGVVARAQAFVGGYGDLSLLAAFCGVPALGLHSESIPADQAELVQALGREGTWGTLTLQSAGKAHDVPLPATVFA
jgi:hypothetical protein